MATRVPLDAEETDAWETSLQGAPLPLPPLPLPVRQIDRLRTAVAALTRLLSEQHGK